MSSASITKLSNSSRSKVASPEFMLNLAIFDLIREPNVRYTHRQIAAVLGVSRSTIFNIETLALAKMKKYAARIEQG